MSDEHCITPDQSHGKCIQLQECKALVNKVHGTNADREFLRRSQCGFFGLHPLVNIQQQKLIKYLKVLHLTPN